MSDVNVETQWDVIKAPRITEKASFETENSNIYTFVVDKKSKKHDIKHAVESIYGVKVLSVRTSVLKGKTRRVGRSIGKRSDQKKALVRLNEGDKIEFFQS